MSAVPQDAVAVTQGDRPVYEIDQAWPPTGRRRGWLMRRLLLAADVLGLVVAYVVALELAPPASTPDRVAPVWEMAIFVATLPLWVLLARIYGLYDRDEERTDHSTVDDVVGVFQVVTLGTWSFLVITHVLDLPYPNLGRLVVFWLLAVALIPLLRAASRAIGRRQSAYIQNVIIVGSGSVAHLLADKIDNHPEYGLRVVGFVDRDDRVARPRNGVEGLIGTTDDLPQLVRERGVHRVAIAFSTDSHDHTLSVIRSMQDSDVQIDIVPRMFEVLGTNAQLHTIEGMPLVGLPQPASFGIVAISQAVVRRCRRDARIGAARARVRHRGGTHQARLQGARVLPAGSDGNRESDVPRLQVQDDGRWCGGSEARARPSEHAQRRRPENVQGAG